MSVYDVSHLANLPPLLAKRNGPMATLRAEFNEEFEEIRLSVKENRVYFWLSLASAVDTPDQQETCRLSGIELHHEDNGNWHAEVVWQSSIWDEKRHVYDYRNNQLEHWITVKGKGHISEVTYLSGTADEHERGSLPGFGAVYVSCPNFIDKPFIHPSEYAANSAGNVTELWGSALNTGPLMFAFGEVGQDGWIAAGLHVKPGAYTFHTMAWNKKRPGALAELDHIVGTQAISLDYLGNEKVDGVWTSPKMVFFAAGDPNTCLAEYCEGLRGAGLVSRAASRKHDWWREPIFCTWHEQAALGQLEAAGDLRGMKAQESSGTYADKITQANVERWLQILDRHGIKPGTIILDAQWQKDTTQNEVDPRRFPDLRGFIDARHRDDQRVLLWMQAWQTEHLPAEWCVCRSGEPVMADPTHPEYRNFVRDMLHRMLGNGPGCYNADGLKVDGTNVLPDGPGLKRCGEVYGFELLHAYLKLIYDTAKAIKEDALISIFAANPYFGDCCDMVRIGDLYTFRGDPIHTMHWRATVFNAAFPGMPIDTDGCFRFSIAEDIEEVLKHQLALGVPCLYQAENLVQMRVFLPNRTRKLSQQDYDAIRSAWAKYRRGLHT